MSARGPFIVKRVRQCGYCDGSGSAPYVPGMEHDTCLRCEGEPVSVLSVKAVADLEDARNAGMHLILDVSLYWGPGKVGAAVYRVWEIGPKGGKVPLPDGGEIEVEATTRERLIADLRRVGASGQFTAESCAVLCKWWNEKHAGGGEAHE